MHNLKRYFRQLLNFIKFVFNLENLNEKEIAGNFLWRSKFSLLPKTKVNLPFSLGRSFRGCAFEDYIEKDPFARMVNQVLISKDNKKAINILLKCYEDELNSFEISPMGSLQPKKFFDNPPWAIVMPWEKISLEDKLEKYIDHFKENRGLHGANFKEGFSNKSLYSPEVAYSQVEQTRRLVSSIKTRGIINSKKLPLVFILKNGTKWRWCMTGEGNHRAYIFAAMKQVKMKAEIYDIVDREKVESWPNVQNGNYTQEEALPVFDSFFEGKICIRGMA